MFNSCFLDQLGMEIRTSSIAQFKASIESSWRVDQDRLTKEMRELNITTIEETNIFLVEKWIPFVNKTWKIEPLESKNCFRSYNFHQE